MPFGWADITAVWRRQVIRGLDHFRSYFGQLHAHGPVGRARPGAATIGADLREDVEEAANAEAAISLHFGFSSSARWKCRTLANFQNCCAHQHRGVELEHFRIIKAAAA